MKCYIQTCEVPASPRAGGVPMCDGHHATAQRVLKSMIGPTPLGEALKALREKELPMSRADDLQLLNRLLNDEPMDPKGLTEEEYSQAIRMMDRLKASPTEELSDNQRRWLKSVEERVFK